MRILLVDDETELVEPLTRWLVREGYQVDVKGDGESALERIRSTPHPYDLLILDWMLPRVSGLAICQTLRAQGDPTPVLFLTAKDTIDDRVQGLDAGGDDYLVKPFELKELLARIRALLRRPPTLLERSDPSIHPDPGAPEPPHDQRLHWGDLELDIANQVAYRQGQPIPLSQKECQLLAYFMEHPGQLLTHTQIYDHLWPPGRQPSSNVLAAQIRLLRRKIEPQTQPASVLIHTIYGKGYRLGFAIDP